MRRRHAGRGSCSRSSGADFCPRRWRGHWVRGLEGPADRVPGGGLQSGETPVQALRRELREEVGLVVDDDPPRVWRQEVLSPRYATDCRW
ncbi:NUDIX domain-containing protein [Lentzea sp. JNUCC 0626]|uniref:NUDIX domain-containing protein n=1 Tax=Lentzea sp. JNUCC 0626 TaxID=3367513 RepID=UPI00374906AB